MDAKESERERLRRRGRQRGTQTKPTVRKQNLWIFVDFEINIAAGFDSISQTYSA